VRRRFAAMERSFPGSLLSADSDSVLNMELPDPNDGHVIAAAIASGADYLVTSDKTGFPSEILARFGITKNQSRRVA